MDKMLVGQKSEQMKQAQQAIGAIYADLMMEIDADLAAKGLSNFAALNQEGKPVPDELQGLERAAAGVMRASVDLGKASAELDSLSA